MPEYRITFLGPRNGKGRCLMLWAERACDAIDAARWLRPELAGRWIDACRTWSRHDGSEERGTTFRSLPRRRRRRKRQGRD